MSFLQTAALGSAPSLEGFLVSEGIRAFNPRQFWGVAVTAPHPSGVICEELLLANMDLSSDKIALRQIVSCALCSYAVCLCSLRSFPLSSSALVSLTCQLLGFALYLLLVDLGFFLPGVPLSLRSFCDPDFYLFSFSLFLSWLPSIGSGFCILREPPWMQPSLSAAIRLATSRF